MFIEKLRAQIERLEKQRTSLDERIRRTRKELFEAGRAHCFTCSECKFVTPIRDLCMVHEFSGGYRPCGEDDHVYNERYHTICSHCGTSFDIKEEFKGILDRPLKDYVSSCIKWYSDSERTPEILRRHYQRQQEQIAKRMRDSRFAEALAAARKLLKDAGEL